MRIKMKYEEIKQARVEVIQGKYASYRNLPAKEIWQKFVDADEYVMAYLYGRAYTGSIAVSHPHNENSADKFHHYLEDSDIYIWLLREKEEAEIQNLCRSIQDRMCLANQSGKEKLQSYVHLIDNEILQYIKLKRLYLDY